MSPTEYSNAVAAFCLLQFLYGGATAKVSVPETLGSMVNGAGFDTVASAQEVSTMPGPNSL
jgi:hypothetical protein